MKPTHEPSSSARQRPNPDRPKILPNGNYKTLQQLSMSPSFFFILTLSRLGRSRRPLARSSLLHCTARRDSGVDHLRMFLRCNFCFILSFSVDFCWTLYLVDACVNKPDLALPVGVFISSIWLLAECWRRFSLVRDCQFNADVSRKRIVLRSFTYTCCEALLLLAL